ncbi:hypothetical protein BJV74DRAFT_951025 [Russula compacta]|nr:hypothetical protein BJV74DRAFT_951025 [Russula compacta]
MVPNFPSPVLSLAAEALKDLDGGDAVTGLWSIFTKCKESLQDGRRLENISWRLWHRHLSASNSPNSLAISTLESLVNSAPYPLTPVSELGARHPESHPASPAPHNPEFTAHPNGATKFPSSLSSSTTPPPVRHTIRAKHISPVGKIICDMIPDKFDPAFVKPPTRPRLAKLDPIIVAADPAPMVAAPIPSVLLPPTPPPPAGLFPRVIVVNPTPHPTPPATPVPTGPPAPLPQTGQHLAPPSRLSAAVARHNSPDATTPSNPGPIPSACPPPPHLPAPVPVAATAPPQPKPPLDPPLDPHPPHLQNQSNQSSHPHPHPRLQALPPPRVVDGTLKPSDRRFFLQQDQSPSPERDGQDRGSNGSINTCQRCFGILPSHWTWSSFQESTFSSGLIRLNSGRPVAQVTRKDPAKPRLPSHPNPDKAPKAAPGPSRPQRSPIDPHPPTTTTTKAQTRHMNGATTVPKVPNAHPVTSPAAAPRRGIVVSNTSSEYGMTDSDEDDDSWASEDVSEGSVDAAAKGTGTTTKLPPTNEDIKLREAALEAQRQRELFVKQPKRSYSNLGRTQSGLLSQLLNPDPKVLPPGHSYHVSSSTHDVARSGVPSTLTSGKSAVAHPLAAQVTAQAPITMTTSSSARARGGYRPKGPPQGEELEDESDSPDDPDDAIQVSHSLAQQRLAALANPSRRRASDNQGQTQVSAVKRPILPTVATAPIPLNHPWNLPAPAPPTTPRTTRRQMLATELSESLRRNLLWERQVSKTNLLGNASRRNGNGSGTRPPTTTMVNGNGIGNAQAGPSQQQQQPQQQLQGQQQERQRRGSGEAVAEESMAERRQRALARNQTWADDFHYAGW